VNVGASIERVFGRSTVRTKPGLKGRYSLPETCLVTPSRHRKPPYGSLRATKRSVAIVMPLRFEIFRIVLAGTLDSSASKRSLIFTLSQLVGDPDLKNELRCLSPLRVIMGTLTGGGIKGVEMAS
jgi:hypothetical protein